MSPLGRILVVIGAIAVFVGAFLPWADLGTDVEAAPRQLSARWALSLGGERASSATVTSFLVFVLLGGVVLVIGAASGSRAIVTIGSVISLGCVGAWLLRESLDRSGASFELYTKVGAGPVVVVVGALVALFAALFLGTRKNAVPVPTAY